MPQTDLQQAAMTFASWAASEGFFDGYSTANAAAIAPGSIANITDSGLRTLRQKQISQVGFNEASDTVFVYLRRVTPSQKAIEQLPSSVAGFGIEYIQGIEDTVGTTNVQPYGNPAWRVRPSAGQNRYACGSSISVGNFADAGTLGALVRGADGTLFGLSNNHVCGSCNHADIGLQIVAPGVLDVISGGLDPFTLGYHHATLTMTPGSITVVDPSQNHDAAIFRIKNQGDVTSYQGDFYDTPSLAVPMASGMVVEKVGRTTGHTRGIVQTQIVGACPISYSASNYGFAGRVYYAPAFYITGEHDLFSDSGDSGSLIVTTLPDSTRVAVGIVVGGGPSNTSPGGKISVALPIHTVLSRLNVSLVSGHNI